MRWIQSSVPAWCLFIILILVQLLIWWGCGSTNPLSALGLMVLSSSVLLGIMFAWGVLYAGGGTFAVVPPALLLIDHIVITYHRKHGLKDSFFYQAMTQFLENAPGSFESYLLNGMLLLITLFFMSVSAFIVGEVMLLISSHRFGGGVTLYRKALQELKQWEDKVWKNSAKSPDA